MANAAATWVMCGVIWFVQLVHYPLFPAFDRAAFRPTMLAHQRRTTWVVFPPMVLELVTAVALLAARPAAVPAWQPWAGAVLVGVWGFSTVLAQVPAHARLASGGFDASVCRRLVASNWLRTAAWSGRAVLCGVMLGEVLAK